MGNWNFNFNRGLFDFGDDTWETVEVQAWIPVKLQEYEV